MSQYSISLKSIININSHGEPYNDDVYANTPKKIERGREIFFNFDYDGDEKFKELFENKFIINYLTENIFCLDIDLFMLALQNDVKIKAPIFYNKYKAIEELKNADLTLGDKTTVNRQLDEEHEDTAKATTKASGSGTGKSKTSQFPQDIENASSFNSINYMDAGNASETSNKSESSNTSDGSGTSKHVESSETLRTVNAFDRIEKYLELQLDIITDFVMSFNNLFMRIW
jgi:hypothetical protein